MFSQSDTQPAPPSAADPAGVWVTPLAPGERAAVVAAFAADPELRAELDAMLGELEGPERRAFLREFARALVGPSAPATPAGPALPGLIRGVELVSRGASL